MLNKACVHIDLPLAGIGDLATLLLKSIACVNNFILFIQVPEKLIKYYIGLCKQM
jgi:hypothetical protein